MLNISNMFLYLNYFQEQECMYTGELQNLNEKKKYIYIDIYNLLVSKSSTPRPILKLGMWTPLILKSVLMVFVYWEYVSTALRGEQNILA